MKANLYVHPALIDDVMRASGRRTKNEAVAEALREYVARRRHPQFTHLFGNIEYETNCERQPAGRGGRTRRV